MKENIYCEKPFDPKEIITLDSGIFKGIPYLILNFGIHPCAYIGVPSGSMLTGMNIRNIPLRCHGGLTFGDYGDGIRPEGVYWLGWDYGHAGDYSGYLAHICPNERKWSTEEILEEVKSVIWDFKDILIFVDEVTSALEQKMLSKIMQVK